MKNTSRIYFCLTLGILLAACSRLTLPPTPIDLAAVKTSAAGTAFAQLTALAVAGTATPEPTSTLEPTSTPQPRSTLSPFQVPFERPIIEPTKIPGLLKSGLSVKQLDALNGHSLQQITGWDYGFHSVEWMDAEHLLLQPVVGQMLSENRGPWEQTRPTVIDLSTGEIWFPPLGETADWDTFFGPPLLRWSPQLEILIAPYQADQENFVYIYNAGGKIVKTYSGKLLGTSPSATKILLADDTWIDLASEKVVDFAWYQNDRGLSGFSTRPFWSPDETRVYVCCYAYGDANTGESVNMPHNDITLDGKKAQEYFSGGFFDLVNFFGTWVLNGNYMLSQWGGVQDANPGFVLLFDPARKTYRNLNTVVGIRTSTDFPGDPTCSQTFAAKGGRYIWMDCFEKDYLIDLATFKTTVYPNYSITDMLWSADGKFAKVNASLDTGELPIEILSVDSKELQPLPENHYCFSWHPADDILPCRSKDGQTLSLLDARSMSTQQEVALPFAFRDTLWSPDGKKFVLVAKDNSLWKIDYPTLENLEQLTSARPELTIPNNYGGQFLLKNLVWSSDGTSLAFIGGRDIYVVGANQAENPMLTPAPTHVPRLTPQPITPTNTPRTFW